MSKLKLARWGYIGELIEKPIIPRIILQLYNYILGIYKIFSEFLIIFGFSDNSKE